MYMYIHKAIVWHICCTFLCDVILKNKANNIDETELHRKHWVKHTNITVKQRTSTGDEGAQQRHPGRGRELHLGAAERRLGAASAELTDGGFYFLRAM